MKSRIGEAFLKKVGNLVEIPSTYQTIFEIKNILTVADPLGQIFKDIFTVEDRDMFFTPSPVKSTSYRAHVYKTSPLEQGNKIGAIHILRNHVGGVQYHMMIMIMPSGGEAPK